MKTILATLVIVLITTIATFAQAPDKMSYQAVIRDASNIPLVNTAVGMRISILQGSVSGTAVYVETQTPVTNSNALITLEIGSGAVVSGSFAGINWSAGPYFIKIETDPSGSTNYTIATTSQIMSVPYALAANKAEIADSALKANHAILADSAIHANNYWALNGNDLYNNSDASIGIGTTTPQSKLHVAGDSANTSIQVTNTATGHTATDGVSFGVAANGDAQLNYGETGAFSIRSNNTNAIQMNSSGNVGIGGAADVTHKLLVYSSDAAIGVDQNDAVVIGDVGGNSSGNYFVSDFGASSKFAFIGANVGIGTTTPIEALEVTGSVRIPAANDYKYATVKTHYYSVSAFAFQPESSSYTLAGINGNVYIASGTATSVGYLDAPVNLPDGATVNSVIFSVVDNDGTYNPQPGELWRTDASTSSSYGLSTVMATAPIPVSTNSSLVQTCTTSTITSPVIDNATYNYWLRWGTQQANSNIRLVRVKIIYTVTKAD